MQSQTIAMNNSNHIWLHFMFAIKFGCFFINNRLYSVLRWRKMRYSVLIVDVVESRKYAVADRNLLQHQINNTIGILNQSFHKVLVKPVGFSSGDEVQGLFRDNVYAYLYFRLLELILFPYPVRGGIGCGEWTTRLDEQGSQAQDGSAYHMARTAIQQVRKRKTQRLCLEDSRCDQPLINVILNASLPLLEALSPGQMKILRLLECICPFNSQSMLDTQLLPGLLHENLPQVALRHVVDIDIVQHVTQTPEDSVTVKNVSEIIATYHQTSRQNVENIMRRGNLLHIRVLDYSAACMLLSRKG